MNFEKIKGRMQRETPADRWIILLGVMLSPLIFAIPLKWYFNLVIWLIFAILFCSFYLWKWGMFEQVETLIFCVKAQKAVKHKEEIENGKKTTDKIQA